MQALVEHFSMCYVVERYQIARQDYRRERVITKPLLPKSPQIPPDAPRGCSISLILDGIRGRW